MRNPYTSSKHIRGKIKGATIQREVIGSKHFLRFPRPAICFLANDLKTAEMQGAHIIDVCDCETGVRYTTSLRYFKSKAFEIDRGYGKQLCLPLEDFNSLWQCEKPEEANVARQPELFSIPAKLSNGG